MIIEMVMQSSFQLIDMFWVGKLGAEAIAAVSMSGIILMVMFSLAIGVSIANNALISRRVGEENFSQAGDVLVQAALISIVITAVCAWIGWRSAGHFLALLGAKGEVLSLGRGYLKISFLGCGAVIFLFVINAAYRGAGHAAEAMTFLIIANTINILIDPCLIFGWAFFPRMGINGAAYGTIFSQLIAVSFQIYWLFKGKLKIVFDRIRIRGKILAVMLAISIPGAFQILLRIMATLIIMKLVSAYGTYAIAAYG
ncbi:MAG: MATE family efflux transporter, partial [bacterium]